MSKTNIDIEAIVRDAIKEKLEDDAYDLICNNLPVDDLSWWAENICKPIKKALVQELTNKENEELLRDCFEQVFAEFFSVDDIQERIGVAVDKYVAKNIKLPKYKIEVIKE